MFAGNWQASQADSGTVRPVAGGLTSARLVYFLLMLMETNLYANDGSMALPTDGPTDGPTDEYRTKLRLG